MPTVYVKTYQFKTQCKGDIRSSKTANIILPVTHDRTKVNALTSASEVVFKFQNQLHYVGWNNSSYRIWILYFTCSRNGVHLFYHESWRGEKFWLRLTAASAQCLSLSERFFHFPLLRRPYNSVRTAVQHCGINNNTNTIQTECVIRINKHRKIVRSCYLHRRRNVFF